MFKLTENIKVVLIISTIIYYIQLFTTKLIKKIIKT